MPPALHVHLLRIGIIELAVAQLAVEGESFAVVAADLLDVVLTHRLHLRLGIAVLVLVVAILLLVCRFCVFVRVRVHSTEPPRGNERDLGRPGHRLFG